MACHAGKSDAPALQMEEEKDVVGREPTPGQHLYSEEVAARQHRHMRGDEVLPGGGLAALWRRRNSMVFEDISDSLVRNVVPEVGEGWKLRGIAAHVHHQKAGSPLNEERRPATNRCQIR